MKVGDIVYLKSGGPDMMGIKNDGKKSFCSWRNCSGIATDVFHVSSLSLSGGVPKKVLYMKLAR